MVTPLELLENYRSDAPVNTIIEIVSEASLREFLPGCVRIQDILQTLAKVSPQSPHPRIQRGVSLPVEFSTVFPDHPHSEYRSGGVPRFLVVDLDSFRSVLVDVTIEKQNK